jgi:hypothetical protein
MSITVRGTSFEDAKSKMEEADRASNLEICDEKWEAYCLNRVGTICGLAHSLHARAHVINGYFFCVKAQPLIMKRSVQRTVVAVPDGDRNQQQAIRIGCAGWNIPPESAIHFRKNGTHLERYSCLVNCCEINSSFYRPHKRRLGSDGGSWSLMNFVSP